MTKLSFKPGDRIGYAARFLKNTGQFTGCGPMRRGTFVAYDFPDNPVVGRVRWDDFDAKDAADRWGDDYAADAIANGQRVLACNIAKVGSAKFVCNDLSDPADKAARMADIPRAR